MRQPQEGILERLQDDIYRLLRSKNGFRRLGISSRKWSNFDTFCNQIIREGMGEGLFVTPPLPRKLIENVPGPVYEQIEFSIQIIENIATNQSGYSAMLTAEKIATLLHLRNISVGGNLWTIRCRTQDPWTFAGDGDKNIITLHFITMGSF
jgi:hypothetical protein